MPPEPDGAHAERSQGLLAATSEAEAELAELLEQDRCALGLRAVLFALLGHEFSAALTRVCACAARVCSSGGSAWRRRRPVASFAVNVWRTWSKTQSRALGACLGALVAIKSQEYS